MAIPGVSEKWMTGIQISIIAVIVVGTFYLSVSDKPAAPFAIASLGTLLLLRFGDIASITLKAFGAEAAITRAERAADDADKAAEDAAKAIEALKQMGMHLSSSVLSMQPLLGRRLYLTIESALGARDTVVSDLEAMGCTPAQIAEVLQPFNNVLAITMVLNASAAMRVDYMARMEAEKKLSAALEREPIDMGTVRAVFAEYEVSDKAERWLSEVERFQETGKVDLHELESD